MQTPLSIAVLPFLNMSSSEENEYFSDGMTEEIINAFAKIEGLKVTSRTSSFFFKKKNIPISQIGIQLKVSTILEGSIRLSGNVVRITAQLIDVNEDFHFWSETFDRSMDNIFAVQDEISLLIADKLREHIGHFDLDDHLVDAPEIPVEIYKQYLKGKYHLQKLNLADLEQGISILQEVIKAQPDFPLAYLAVHAGYTILGVIGLMPADETFATGKYYLDKAIELNPNLPECQYNLAGISYWQNWDIGTALQHLNKALEMRPGYAEAYQTMAPILLTAGKPKAALNYIDTALQLDPFTPMNYYLKGLIYYRLENFEKAIPYFKKSTELDPDFIFSKLIWAFSFLLMGRVVESLKMFQSFPNDRLGTLFGLGGTTISYIFLNENEKAEAGITQLKEALQTDSMGWAMYFLILTHTLMGKYDEAIKLIEQGITHRSPLMITLSSEPILNPLSSIPRFQELLQQIIGKEHFQNFSQKKYKPASLKPKKQLEILPEQVPAKKKPLLDEATHKAYSQKLLALIETHAPYLKPDISLRILAEQIGMYPNQLSWLLNEHFGKSFNSFINHYRVEAFKQLAINPKNSHITIIGLAYESGFNSKTVFNTYFKKEMGMTPKSWLKSATKE